MNFKNIVLPILAAICLAQDTALYAAYPAISGNMSHVAAAAARSALPATHIVHPYDEFMQAGYRLPQAELTPEQISQKTDQACDEDGPERTDWTRPAFATAALVAGAAAAQKAEEYYHDQMFPDYTYQAQEAPVAQEAVAHNPYAYPEQLYPYPVPYHAPRRAKSSVFNTMLRPAWMPAAPELSPEEMWQIARQPLPETLPTPPATSDIPDTLLPSIYSALPTDPALHSSHCFTSASATTPEVTVSSLDLDDVTLARHHSRLHPQQSDTTYTIPRFTGRFADCMVEDSSAEPSPRTPAATDMAYAAAAAAATDQSSQQPAQLDPQWAVHPFERFNTAPTTPRTYDPTAFDHATAAAATSGPAPFLRTDTAPAACTAAAAYAGLGSRSAATAASSGTTPFSRTATAPALPRHREIAAQQARQSRGSRMQAAAAQAQKESAWAAMRARCDESFLQASSAEATDRDREVLRGTVQQLQRKLPSRNRLADPTDPTDKRIVQGLEDWIRQAEARLKEFDAAKRAKCSR